jgi:hypothetical protein
VQEDHGAARLTELIHVPQDERLSTRPFDFAIVIRGDDWFPTIATRIFHHRCRPQLAPALIDDPISGQPIQPGREFAVASKCVELAVDGDENFLNQVLRRRIGFRAEDRNREPEDLFLVSPYEKRKQLVIAQSQKVLDQLLVVVGSGGCDGVRPGQSNTPGKFS